MDEFLFGAAWIFVLYLTKGVFIFGSWTTELTIETVLSDKQKRHCLDVHRALTLQSLIVSFSWPHIAAITHKTLALSCLNTENGLIIVLLIIIAFFISLIPKKLTYSQMSNVRNLKITIFIVFAADLTLIVFYQPLAVLICCAG